MWRHLASNVLTLLIGALIVAFGGVLWAQREYAGAGPLEQAICLQVPPGSNMRRVADDLAGEGAISNATIFRLGADYADKAPRLKAGSFLIDEGWSMERIVDEITGDGRSTCGTQVVYLVGVAGQEVRVRMLDAESQEFETVAEFDPAVADVDWPEVYAQVLDEPGTEFSVSIAEGVTSWQVVNALIAWGLMDGEVAEVPAEGTLAPDRYEVRPGQSLPDFVAELVRIQAERLATAWENRAEDAPVETPEEALILASIIEKETGVAEERPLVASVFANRLAQGIRLQTDPTVIYGITKGEGILGRGLRQSELRRETPWNTYVIDGLPPTPIANPGLAAIEAALDPAESDYIFFVAKRGGGHAFAVTLPEHNRNVADYRAWQAELEAEASDN
jgi:UPF0755 protein